LYDLLIFLKVIYFAFVWFIDLFKSDFFSPLYAFLIFLKVIFFAFEWFIDLFKSDFFRLCKKVIFYSAFWDPELQRLEMVKKLVK